MKLTKEAITNNTTISGIEGYICLVMKIENNLDNHPDIAIESCKSLIEGLCKKSLSLFDEEYISTKKIRSNLDNNYSDLVKRAFKVVFLNQIELELNETMAILIDYYPLKAPKIESLIQRRNEHVHRRVEKALTRITAIRNNRGDISHGRIYPKPESSSCVLAKSIASMTDGICFFMINCITEKQKLIDLENDKLIYDDLTIFNDWLNDKINNPFVTKFDVSKNLYLHSYDKYVELFDEYTEQIALIDNSILEEVLTEENEEPRIIEMNSPITIEDILFLSEIDDLKLNCIADELNLNKIGFRELVLEYLDSTKLPLPEEVIRVMNKKPQLRDRQNKIKEITESILLFIKDKMNGYKCQNL